MIQMRSLKVILKGQTSDVWYSLLCPSGTSIIPLSLSHVTVDNVKASLLLFKDARVKLFWILSFSKCSIVIGFN